MAGSRVFIPHPQRSVDLLVIGGGINGCGIARDAAGRGLSVLLCEQDDLAAHTSSASTKLIHGGLRYLEHFEFGLVRKALQEREVLLAAAPHIMWPLRFVMPHDAHLRPAWMIRAGLFLYDHLAARRLLPGSSGVDLRRHAAGQPLRPGFQRGFVYSDGWVDDARLVVLNALDAAEHGARILTRTRCQSIERQSTNWVARLESADGQTQLVQARSVVNATGPWVSEFLARCTPVNASRHIRLVKGSHIVVRQIFEHRFAYIFQNTDRRVVFAIPYEGEFTLIGTTDVDYHGDPAAVSIEPQEIRYLCDTVNRYFQRQIGPEDVCWSYSGVRPLLDDESSDASEVTRDYAIDVESTDPPLISIFGGKITTYRKLAEDVMGRLAPLLQCTAPAWTKGTLLPGGDLPSGSFAAFLRVMERRYPWLPASLRTRYARAYGTRAHRFLAEARVLEDLGEEIVPGLYEREARYLQEVEWARSADDILWRRTKLGLQTSPADRERLTAWLEGKQHTTLASSTRR